ncbi:hypothetical protein [Kitasatospora sp. NPDC088351]|uniref:recombination directionality factor n=1 Tax=unclassified Kitasatospora TaxID=2633591 RepID=UPI003418E6C5
MPITAVARNPHVTIPSAPVHGAREQCAVATPPPAGQFHTGRRVGNRPESLPNWRLTDTTEEIAEAVARAFGGVPMTDGALADLITTSPVLPIVLDSADSVTTQFRLWGPKGLIHHCDGERFLSPSDRHGTVCGCPTAPDERAALAKALQAPQPDTTVSFRLAGHRYLGRFEFRSPSRLFADSAAEVRAQLAEAVGETRCELALELITVPATGGIELSFRTPRLTVVRPSAQ